MRRSPPLRALQRFLRSRLGCQVIVTPEMDGIVVSCSSVPSFSAGAISIVVAAGTAAASFRHHRRFEPDRPGEFCQRRALLAAARPNQPRSDLTPASFDAEGAGRAAAVGVRNQSRRHGNDDSAGNTINMNIPSTPNKKKAAPKNTAAVIITRTTTWTRTTAFISPVQVKLPPATRNFYVDGHVPQPH